MEVLLESEEQMGRNKQKGRVKRQRPKGPPASSPAVVAEQTGRLLAEREREWLERLTTDPASFAAVELEVEPGIARIPPLGASEHHFGCRKVSQVEQVRS